MNNENDRMVITVEFSYRIVMTTPAMFLRMHLLMVIRVTAADSSPRELLIVLNPPGIPDFLLIPPGTADLSKFPWELVFLSFEDDNLSFYIYLLYFIIEEHLPSHLRPTLSTSVNI